MAFVSNSKIFLGLAFPMIISNVFVPLVGLVDTAIVGHLPGTHYLAGVALGSLIITQLIWLCGFLRMSTTGLSAIGHGSGNIQSLADVLKDGALLALGIGILLLLLQQPLFNLGLYFSDASEGVEDVASSYFGIRIYIIPISLFNLVLVGWMLGQQWHRQVMVIQIIANICNVVLSYLLAIKMSMGVPGVAIATVLAELIVFALGGLVIIKRKPELLKYFKLTAFSDKFKNVLFLNSNMFVRNFVLQVCLAIITFAGLQHSELTAASNAVLMQFFVLVALGLDGIAYAVEALIGEAKGKKDVKAMRSWMKLSLVWSNGFALVYSFMFLFFFSQIAALITDIPELKENMENYYWYIVVLPVIAHWCFTFDGIYIGIMRADIMRNSMMFSGLFAFVPLLIIFDDLNNHLIWSVFLVFLLVRGVSLGGHLTAMLKRGEL